MRARHSRRMELMSLATKAFCQGDRGATGPSLMPMARRRCTKTGPYEVSRSLMRYRGARCQVFHDDLFNPLANITHRSNLVFLDWAAAGTGSQPSRNGLVVDFRARLNRHIRPDDQKVLGLLTFL